MTRTLFTCVCGDVSHQLIMEYDPENWNEHIYVYVHLAPLPFWKRLQYAIFYIFGKRSRFGSGAFEEILLDKQTTNEFIGSLLKCYYEMPNVPPLKLEHSNLTLDQSVL